MDTRAIISPTSARPSRRYWFRAAAALVALMLVLGLIVHGLRLKSVTRSTPPDEEGDVALYGRVIDRLRQGEPYYPTIVAELRANNYPLRPFVAVRPPALSLILAALPGTPAAQIALATLAFATFAAWAWRLRSFHGEPLYYAARPIVLATGIIPALAPNGFPLHEIWAGLLIALSLALRRPDGWFVSVVLATVAALLRELAAPYLLAMAVLAWKDGYRREAIGWLCGLSIFAVALVLHAQAVSAVVSAADQVSPPWLAFGGWSFVLQTAFWNPLLMFGPDWLGALLLPLALLGLAMRRDALGQRLALTVLGYTAAFLVVGRTDNFYWGFMIAPLWPLGLMFVWPALVELSKAIVDPIRGRSAHASDSIR